MPLLMNNVTVKKSELLDTLKVNLKQHEIDVAEALVARHEEMKSYFDRMRERLIKEPEFQGEETITFPKPRSHADEYRKAIKMVEMSVDSVIELTEDQFDKLVMDNWSWKHELMRTSAMYGKMM